MPLTQFEMDNQAIQHKIADSLKQIADYLHDNRAVKDALEGLQKVTDIEVAKFDDQFKALGQELIAMNGQIAALQTRFESVHRLREDYTNLETRIIKLELHKSDVVLGVAVLNVTALQTIREGLDSFREKLGEFAVPLADTQLLREALDLYLEHFSEILRHAGF